MASQKGRDADTSYVRGFIEEMRSSGFVAKAIARYGIEGAAVAPAGDARISGGTMEGLKDGTHLYEVERRASHAERPGFRINELQISPEQKVPWHYHSNIQDTFYVLEGEIRIFLRDPNQEVRLKPGATYTVAPGRPHLVANGGRTSATFLVLQGIGPYDFVPLV